MRQRACRLSVRISSRLALKTTRLSRAVRVSSKATAPLLTAVILPLKTASARWRSVSLRSLDRLNSRMRAWVKASSRPVSPVWFIRKGMATVLISGGRLLTVPRKP